MARTPRPRSLVTGIPPVTAATTADNASSAAQVLAFDRDALVAVWKALHGSPPPRSISQPLLRRILAFDLQLRDSGGWPEELQARLARLVAGGSRVRAAEPKSGGRLLREWNGTTHVVEIIDGGYCWNGQAWRSLSVIAREITGAHWSGPRFFGLKKEGKVGDKKSRQPPGRARGSNSGGVGSSGKGRPATSTRRSRSAEVQP